MKKTFLEILVILGLCVFVYFSFRYDYNNYKSELMKNDTTNKVALEHLAKEVAKMDAPVKKDESFNDQWVCTNMPNNVLPAEKDLNDNYSGAPVIISCYSLGDMFGTFRFADSSSIWNVYDFILLDETDTVIAPKSSKRVKPSDIGRKPICYHWLATEVVRGKATDTVVLDKIEDYVRKFKFEDAVYVVDVNTERKEVTLTCLN